MQLNNPNKYCDPLILFVFPLILAFINSNWIFTPATNYIPDPWFYLAYFRYFFEYSPAFPSNTHYFVERLTWNVPGHYLYELLPPLQANYFLHLIVYYVAVFSLYGTLNLLFNRRTALISALLMGGYPWFLRAVGWDYTDGAWIAHMLVLIYHLTFAQYSDRYRLWLLLAGAVHSSLLITNLSWLGYALSWTLYFIFLNIHTKKFRGSHFIFAAGFFLIGSLVPVVVAGLFYYQVTGNYFFLLNSIRSAISLTSDNINVQWVLFIYGHQRPIWHTLPIVIAVVSIWRIFSSKRDKTNYIFIAIYILFLSAYGWLTFWHYFSIPLLNVFTYSSYVMPAVFLLIGATVSTYLNELSGKNFNIVTAWTVVLLALPFILLFLFPNIENLPGNIFIIATFSIMLLALLILPSQKVSFLLIVCALTFLYFFVGESSYVYISDRLKGRENFLAIISASQTIDAYYPHREYDDFRLWFRADENYDTFFSLASLYLYPWGSALGNPLSRKDPPLEFHLEKRDILEPEDHIIIVSSNSNRNEIVSDINSLISNRDVRLELLTTKTIQEGKVRFVLYFTKVESLP